MGLLNYLTATSLDEDYAHVSDRRAATEAGEGSQTGGSRRTGIAGLVILAVFGILVATAAVQTSRTADDARAGHDELVKQVQARKQTLADQRGRAQELLRETQTLQTAFLRATAQGRSLQSRLARLGLVTGAAPATGPGVR